VNPQTLTTLIGYNYWGNARILDMAAGVSQDHYVAPGQTTTRNLRDTLLHTLDTEWSWRLRLQGRPIDEWGPEMELIAESFPTVTTLAARWREDEREMRAWTASLTTEDLVRVVDLGRVNDTAPRDRFPLWYFLLHVLNHSTMQRADAATLLTAFGQSPGDLDFLNFADTLPAPD
jgi:uncharacterized damage-inducible protein DinB